tara:strand:+ start:65 stop:568 length:504 start_codon:yes stop_codon:yes gene_type:complete
MRRKDDQYKNGLFTWFIGSVEEINDPKGLNRVKVRAYGYYDSEEIKTTDLPWATVMMPVTSASIKGNGGNHHLEKGSWVVGFFRDGPSAQDPVVIGSIATQTDGTKDLPSEASVDNKVYKSKAGHLIEIDNKDGAEELRITHKSGSYIHMKEDGTIELKSLKKTRVI